MLEQVRELHGVLVATRKLPDGRAINTYQSEREEVTLELNPDEQSCLVSHHHFPAR